MEFHWMVDESAFGASDVVGFPRVCVIGQYRLWSDAVFWTASDLSVTDGFQEVAYGDGCFLDAEDWYRRTVSV